MPLIHMTLSHDAIPADRRRGLVAALTEAALRAESVPDTPEARQRCLILVNEAPEGAFNAGGAPAERTGRALFLDFTCSAGVLDAARKARFAADLQAAALAASATGEARPAFTSVIFHEVPEGNWGRIGTIWRLPQMTAVSRFAHLTSIAAE